MMGGISESFIFLKNLNGICLYSKAEYKIDNEIGDEGCLCIFNNAKFLSNLEELDLGGNKEKQKNRMSNNI